MIDEPVSREPAGRDSVPLAGLISVVVALTALSPIVFAPAAQARERVPSCKRAGSTIAQNSLVRVYRLARPEYTGLYSCRRSTGTRVRLARSFDDVYTEASFSSVRLRGYYVAWADSSYDISCKDLCPPGYEPTKESIKLYNIRTRGSRTVAGYPIKGALVLGKGGAIAWASRSAGTGQIEIRFSVRPGDNRILDSGNIPPGSLAIDTTIISWTRDGVERFARLR